MTTLKVMVLACIALFGALLGAVVPNDWMMLRKSEWRCSAVMDGAAKATVATCERLERVRMQGVSTRLYV